ncbi:hypothetical protein VNO77_43256 [Canavalia gladiata]|uniref:Elongation factor-like 1 n=1 Tax=Canavalia gladiata TaxID=3824 RepID=A0AAN9JVY9_CANGL
MEEGSCESDTKNIRNICILAHVDHGKTTLADHLISAAGGGVHPKLAGRVRFMDYLDEEQRRTITMKSSSILLCYQHHSINLIDSPGHVDFCSEVSTAARLSDEALVLMDAVEGVHIQTHAVLRQCSIERLTPLLVLNKIDRLITELKLSPSEAYTRLSRIVHEVNAIFSAFESEKYFSDMDSPLAGTADDSDEDNKDVFRPQKGNVVFACALDGWGFGIREFAEIYASRHGVSVKALQKALWGPMYFDSKAKMIVGKKGIGSAKDKPMFVRFILEPLWKIYEGGLQRDIGLLHKLIRSFNLSIPARELQNKDPKLVLPAVMTRWLPLSNTILSMVVRCMPDPVSAQSFRISRLIPKKWGEEVEEEVGMVRKAVEQCDCRPQAPCVAFVSKMFAVPVKMLPPGDEGEGELDECFLAFARIFSGVLSAGQRIYVLSALYDPRKGETKHVQEAQLKSLCLMMGQGLKLVSSAKAGNIVAIRGLGHHILKSATLSSTKNCWPFSSMAFQVAPTLRVAIEPSDPADVGALRKGLMLLNQADPIVEVTVSARGEHVLAAAGEVHLERCIKDLKERFAKVSLEVSPPPVSYRETVEGDVSNVLENLKVLDRISDYVEKTTPNGRCVVRVQVMKLLPSLTKVLDENSDLLGDIVGIKSGRMVKGSESIVENDNQAEGLKKHILDAVEGDILSRNINDKDYAEKCKLRWLKILRRIWALGPSNIGPNLLLTPDIQAESTDNSVLICGCSRVSERIGFVADSSIGGPVAETSSDVEQALYMDAKGLEIENSVISGFQLATSTGPLCDEPMWGLAFIVEARVFPFSVQHDGSETHQQSQQYSTFAGEVMGAVKDACIAAVLQNKPRLVEAMYSCELNTPTENLRPMYDVLARRRARVLKEEMQEGSPFFTVHAYVPASESFSFAYELRRWTSGAASALLNRSHWEALPEDPFFVPKTDEEIEELGDGSSVLPNTARKLIDAVRRRKGLPVEEKVVQHATKQRTRARKV